MQSGDASEITPEQRTAARQAAGLPAEPNPAQRQVYLESLNAIDTDIVHGKDDKAVSRGINQCGTVKNSPDDHIKPIKTTNSRFTSPNHPDGHGTITAERILQVVRQSICPTSDPAMAEGWALLLLCDLRRRYRVRGCGRC
ncbi:hypothetical protein ACYCCF_29975 [Streptomyces argenteolus]|uniref:hypothetical protein n=1 Tax=Streptomyces sp. NPDC025273 TaxID=3155251 RepID=UPI0033FBC68F